MKLLVCVSLALVAVVAAEKNKTTLLGADDVDKKMAIRLGDKLPEPPKTLREIKQLAKDDRMQLKEMQSRARALKHNISDKNKSKSEKKNLKRQYKALKRSLHSKKSELNTLKGEMRVIKMEGKHKKNGLPKFDGLSLRKMLNGDPIRTTTKPTTTTTSTTTTTTTTTTPAPTTTTTTTTPAPINKKDARRKSQRKSNKRNKKKNRLQADAPAVSVVTASSHGRGGHKKKHCETTSDCPSGAHCLENKRGHKRCKSNGMNKAAGKKCHISEQCRRGLKCFVTKTAEQASHKKHPRRGKGVCADPATTDASKGTFLPFTFKA